MPKPKPASEPVPLTRSPRPKRPAPAPRTTASRSRSEVRAAKRERRRFEKSEIRRFTRRARHRRLGWAVAAGLVAILAALLAVAVYSPLLALRTITVEGTRAVSAKEVTAAIDGQLGTPLAQFDYDRLRSQLDAFPLIRSFVTEVVPPSTLIVHIVERSPVGAVATASGFAIVDPAGVILNTTARRADGVPLIDVGKAGTDSPAFSAVVDVLLSLPESVRSRVDVATATSKDDVQLVLLDGGQRVVWGSAERSALKARVLQELIAVQGSNARVEYDVSAPLSPVVRSR
ncbi:MAG: FtsQ-type POTRA domain-containing protein [Salinibacterium sp.]|nr:FtsQ-type POTRA domain-containing protein [Salinibacterium sp.]